ncbi:MULTISPECIES: DUF883 domain-containing protein [unclassified Arsukibacterium]|uniref:DUF883 domain-containing protein n=1 Tax=unclassified Arsukibacterium TaxID=2635278 RepID=UPI000C530874|nr:MULTISPECIES: DUF883 domain-containing protein [unclassified Arsukibacterium]MAA93827.1 DUF883 domain-containing protein [Rheinheimera sp.]MBM34381.1 DUF883 domain-containing protein [Rheinheimera sp.]HAW92094.1 DUF883 domain-containing protein [Candidatus Azambacteria bacterium]|tara:strand:- start:1417 stop:1746 length:330 start_codon:yes stop_codon:yes gene_type:complete
MATTQTGSKAADNSTATPLTNSPVTEKASEAAHHAVDTMAGKAATAEDSLRRTAASSKATIDQKQEELKMQMQGSYERSKQFAQENPLAAAGIAFAAGMLVSTLLRRGN